MIQKIIIVLSFFAFSIPLTICTADEPKALREILVASENVDELFSIDDYYTYVRPRIVFFGLRSGSPTEELSQEIVSACKNRMEVEMMQRDPITQQMRQTWIPYDGKEYIFGRFAKDSKDGSFHMLSGFRCIGEFEIAQNFAASNVSNSKDSIKYFMIKHAKRQPFVFKSEQLSPGQIIARQDGEIDILKISVGGILKGLVGKTTDTDALLYEYAVGLCRKDSGTMRFVINKGRFVADPKSKWIDKKTGDYGWCETAYAESTAVDVMNYIVMPSSVSRCGTQKVILYACEGKTPFAIRSEAIAKYTKSGDIYYETKSYFANNRGLEGITYVPLTTTPASSTTP